MGAENGSNDMGAAMSHWDQEAGHHKPRLFFALLLGVA